MKNYKNIQQLKEKLLFTVNDVADIFGITRGSAWVLCSRYVKAGIFVRLKNNLYILDMKWDSLSLDEFFKISNFIQVPSYVSFLSALSYFEISTQVQRNVFESVSLKRSKTINIKKTAFNYYKTNEKLYFGFVKDKDFFIASPEKALADAIYLISLGRYSLDLSSLDLNKIDKNKLVGIVDSYPKRTQNLCKSICKI